MDPPDFSQELLGGLLNNLSEDDIKNISSLIENLSASDDSKEESKAHSDTDTGGGFDIDPEMLFRLMSIFEKLNSNINDPTCNLITALKPLLSPGRREKADHAIELLRLMNILSMGDIFNPG